MSDHAIRALVKQKISPDLQKMHQIRDVEGLWKSDHRIHKSLDELNADLDIINVRNGLYDVQKNQLMPHSKEILSTVQLDVAYNPSASGEVFTEFLNFVVPDPDSQLLIQEMSGYAMSQRHCAKKFFMLIGPRDSGKTTFLNILNSLLGQKNVSSVAFQNIGDRFATAVLFGKTANISTETPDAGIQDVGKIKALVGQDMIEVERKGQDHFRFVNRATLIFAANNMPMNNGDKTDAFYRKMIVVPFPRKIADGEMDVYLPKALEAEKEYIFLWAMEGLRRLEKNGFKFTAPKASMDKLDVYQMEARSVYHFVLDCCHMAKEHEVGSKDLYSAYEEYCFEQEIKSVSTVKFANEISREFPNVQRKLITNDRIAGFRGLKLTS